ncbi:Oidioi.mRNA.OKI2018_I69.chr1.g3187.t1.cds [Oikopleura dioica]|uniref:Tektin n=1 Tax=Oikopleura dioica TaxID=34765 RepID=A0ABN7SXM3_OIKDI|nr:Oidioi.mRNA.OKI2018_I69.chr1.g3187.t1.cds [Oikopleura dioica]
MKVRDGGFLPNINAQTTSADTYRNPSQFMKGPKTFARNGPSSNYQSSATKSYIPPVSSQSGIIVGDKSASPYSVKKFSPEDWHRRNQKNNIKKAPIQDHFATSDAFRASSERLRADTYALVQERDQLTAKNQAHSTKNIDDRANDIDFWKSELRHETELLISETSSLSQQKKQLERALAETESPLGISKECLYNRDKREGIDLVHDAVEIQLNQEVEVIRFCQEKMKRLIARAERQLQRNRDAQHELDKDSHDKVSAASIDNRCYQLKNISAGINYFRGIEDVDRTQTIPSSWAKFSDDNIRRSQAERNSSTRMREEIETCLAETSNQMWSQWNRVNVAFTHRVAEQVDTKNTLQSHLNRTLQEIHDVETTIKRLHRAIADKELPVKVAETRLDERTRRPNLELCRDPAQLMLVSEVKQLQATLASLRQRLDEEQHQLQKLVTARSKIEHEIRTKANSIFIDQDKCMSMRKTFPTTPRLSGYSY